MSAVPTTYLFGGGLDVSTQALAVPPGRIVSGMNYEPLSEGYGRVDGFERFDGRIAPSAAQFWVLPFHVGSAPIGQGDTVQGLSSGATGYVLRSAVDFTGSWDAGTAAGSLILALVSGDFLTNELLTVAGLTKALANGPTVADSAPTEVLRRSYLQLAQERHRFLIGTVPGSGPVRGVCIYDDDIYAWRDNEAGTAGGMFKASSAGWVAVPLGYRMGFTAGTSEIIENTVIVGATSGASAIVRRVVRQSGDWGSTAAGFVIMNTFVGAFTPGETLTFGATPVATAGAVTANAIPPGGRYMVINHNFYGSAAQFRMYAVNGVGRAFEFDGQVFAPIETGMPDDRPTRIFELSNHLGLCFPGGSVQTSSIGEPLIWDAVLGATEFGIGTEVTDVLQSTETAVVIFGAQKIAIFSGRDAASFELAELTEEAGADPWTAQRIAKTVYLDRRGLRDLAATQAYGNFKAGSLLEIIAPYFRAKRKAGARSVLSYVCRAKSQYRLVWDDGTGLCVYLGRKAAEAIPFSTDDVRFRCAGTGELPDGEGMFAGGEDGYVYRLDSGASFDGVGIRGFVMTPFNHLGAVKQEKNLRKTSIELQAEPLSRIGITVMFDYSDGEQPRSGSSNFVVQGSGTGHDFIVQGGGGIWDTSLWNQFFWSAPFRGTCEAYTEGEGVNMSAIIACDSTPTENAHVLESYTFHTLPRKLRR